MKTKTLFQTLGVVVAGVILTQAGFAVAPSGSITSPTFSGPGQGLYDLTGVLTEMSDDFNGGQSNVITISENVGIVQAITGTITATGTATTVTVMDNSGSFTFSAKYTLKGSVKSSGSNVQMSLAFTGKGSAVLGDGKHQLSESVTYLATVNPVAGTMTGRKTGTASESGHGGGTAKILNPTFSGPVPPGFTPIDWHLSLMSLAATGTKVTGTATVNLANSRSFPFNVKGTYSATTGLTKLTLTGTGPGKGATLTVTTTGNNITAITGSLLGQQVKLSRS